MDWRIEIDSAWFKLGEQVYRHYCGAAVKKRGNLWIPISRIGAPLRASRTALEAIRRLEATDDHHSFWRFRQWTDGNRVWGCRDYGEFEYVCRPIFTAEEHDFFALCVCDTFPSFLKSYLARSFFFASVCVACGKPMKALQTQKIQCFDTTPPSPKSIYLACDCGYPVWKMDSKAHSHATCLLDAAARNWRRAQRLKAAGGKHSARELEKILKIQNGRCLYCNKDLTTGCRPSKDHLLPVTKGGSDFAFNIVLACRNCNSRRGNIPFRTFCKLLSPTQNRRILLCLGLRLVDLKWEEMPAESLCSLLRALALHDPNHPRYRDILTESQAARRNASKNRLLPGRPAMILNRLSNNLKQTQMER